MSSIKSNKINPIPVRDDIVSLSSNKHMNQPWELWFRKVYNILDDIGNTKLGQYTTSNSTSATPISGFNYTVDGNRFFFNYSGVGDVSIDLPFPVKYDVVYKYFSITKGTTKLYIPLMTSSTIINEWFFLDN